MERIFLIDIYVLTQITGTGHGIGKELAHQYASLGAVVVCWDINQELNEATVQELRKIGGKAYGYKYV
jgi:NAD(P)-dependent dehydrogenase (short-subunit alcohol dehydrogenase family)